LPGDTRMPGESSLAGGAGVSGDTRMPGGGGLAGGAGGSGLAGGAAAAGAAAGAVAEAQPAGAGREEGVALSGRAQPGAPTSASGARNTRGASQGAAGELPSEREISVAGAGMAGVDSGATAGCRVVIVALCCTPIKSM